MRACSPRLIPALICATLLVGATPIFLVAQTSKATQSKATETALVGTWVLDLSKSKYFPGPPPRSETRVYTQGADGVHGIIDRVYADGRRETISYLANFDNEMAVTGTPAYDAIKLRQVDEYTAESVLSHAGMVYGTAKRTLSRDGKTMTIQFQRRTSEDTISNTALYHRQE